MEKISGNLEIVQRLFLSQLQSPRRRMKYQFLHTFLSPVSPTFLSPGFVRPFLRFVWRPTSPKHHDHGKQQCYWGPEQARRFD